MIDRTGALTFESPRERHTGSGIQDPTRGAHKHGHSMHPHSKNSHKDVAFV